MKHTTQRRGRTWTVGAVAGAAGAGLGAVAGWLAWRARAVATPAAGLLEDDPLATAYGPPESMRRTGAAAPAWYGEEAASLVDGMEFLQAPDPADPRFALIRVRLPSPGMPPATYRGREAAERMVRWMGNIAGGHLAGRGR